MTYHFFTHSHTRTDLGCFNRQMAKAGYVGGSLEECDWLWRFIIYWKARIWLVLYQQTWLIRGEVSAEKSSQTHLFICVSKFTVISPQLKWPMIFLPAGSASSSRTSSQSGCPLHEAPPYEATATRKGEGPGEGKVGQSKTPADSIQSPPFLQTCTQHQHPTAAWRACRLSVNFSTILYTHARVRTHTPTRRLYTQTHTHTPRCPSGFSHSWHHPCCECSDAAMTRWVCEWKIFIDLRLRNL